MSLLLILIDNYCINFRADSLDAGVRGRFSREISLPVPDAPSRTKILTLMTAKMKLAEDVDLSELCYHIMSFQLHGVDLID